MPTWAACSLERSGPGRSAAIFRILLTRSSRSPNLLVRDQPAREPRFGRESLEATDSSKTMALLQIARRHEVRYRRWRIVRRGFDRAILLCALVFGHELLFLLGQRSGVFCCQKVWDS